MTDDLATSTVSLDIRALPGRIDPNMEIFAIGYVHGQAAVLRAVLTQIRARPCPPATQRLLIFLGDLIDHDPDSIGAVNLAMSAPSTTGADRAVMLPANHELEFLNVLAGNNTLLWFQNGGRTVMAEVDPDWRSRPWDDILPELTAAFPAEWITAIKAEPSHLKIGDLHFVHAGIDPLADRDCFLARDKSLDDMHWATIRNEFITWNKGWDLDDAGIHTRGQTVVVHGHTPALVSSLTDTTEERAQMDGIDGYRAICLDAGAAYRQQIGWARFWSERDRSMVEISATFAPAHL